MVVGAVLAYAGLMKPSWHTTATALLVTLSGLVILAYGVASLADRHQH